MSFSENLQFYRQQGGLTQEQLAETLGVSASRSPNGSRARAIPRWKSCSPSASCSAAIWTRC